MIKKTAQTKYIYDYIKSSRHHPSAEDIYSEAQKRLPYITRATVYNVLRRLVRAGEVRELYLKKGLTVYDGNPEPHPHFKCRRCGAIQDVFIDGFAEFIEDVKKKFSDAEVELNIFSLCERCRNSSK